MNENLTVNEQGNLAVAGVDAIELAEEYGTPVYIMNEDLIRHNCRLFKESIDKYYGGNGLVCYASKAFSCLEIYRIVASEGLGVDVVSGGELFAALKAGTDASKICFHGNNKTAAELEYALENKVGRIVADNIPELHMLNKIAEKMGVTADIMFRVKPGVDAHTHDFVRVGKIDSKFGFAIETGEAFEAVKLALSSKFVRVKGLHCHIGSQIFDVAPFEAAAEIMLGFIAEIRNKLGYEIEELNLGGGFGIKYTDEDTPVPFVNYMESVSEVVRNTCENLNIKQPFIFIEPGRSVVGEAGTTLYTVGARKEIPNIRTYLSVDGSMCDNPRYSLYGAKYDAIVANRAEQERSETVTVAGKCCETDTLIEEVKIQHADSGDILAVLSTGAYNYSMASHYNKTPNPPVVFIKDGQSRIAVRRETYEDLVRNDV